MGPQQLVFDKTNRVMRMRPVMPVGGMQTYQISMPIETHWRAADCAEVDCEHHLKGWSTTVLPDSADERLIRGSGRHWTSAEKTPDGFVRYVFPAGQACFAASRHKVQLDRPGVFLLAEGDWRWKGARRVFDRPDQWVDHFANHQDKIAERVNRG